MNSTKGDVMKRNLIIIVLSLIGHILLAQTKIHIPEPFGDQFIESELISEVTLIPLIIDRYGMITPDMEMKVDGDNYFILDNKFKQCVYRFNNAGELLNTICEQKKKNEDESLPDLNNPIKFSIDPFRKQVDVYNFEHSIVYQYKYSGTKVGQFNLNVNPADFIRDNKGDYWIYTGWNNSETPYRLLKADKNGSIIDRKLRLPTKCTPTEGFSFYNAGNEICFWELFGNATYTIDNNAIKPEYLFNFGNYNLPRDYHILKGDESFVMINKSGYYTVKKFIENNDFAYFFLNFNSNSQREMFHVIHDKKANQVHIYIENAAIAAFDKAQSITNNNELLFLVSPRKIRQLLGGGTDFVPAPFMGIDEKAAETGDLRNPVILKIKLQSIVDYKPEMEFEGNDSLYFDN